MDEHPHLLTGRLGKEVPSEIPIPKAAKARDGRRNNQTPVEHRIKPGEIRNPNGRRGKKRLVDQTSISSVDEHYLGESFRIVSNGDGGPVNAIQRLVQEEFRDALVDRDPMARARVLKEVREASERYERLVDQAISVATVYKEGTAAEFRRARALRQVPPDIIPHPAHVNIEGRAVWFSGPLTHEDRHNWETIKAAVKVAAFFHNRYREALKTSSSAYLRDAHDSWAKHRRWLMRAVPKGWDWKEVVWCRDSNQQAADDVISMVNRMSIAEEMRVVAEDEYVEAED